MVNGPLPGLSPIYGPCRASPHAYGAAQARPYVPGYAWAGLKIRASCQAIVPRATCPIYSSTPPKQHTPSNALCPRPAALHIGTPHLRGYSMLHHTPTASTCIFFTTTHIIMGYLDWCHYNFASSKNYHYYLSILNHAITIHVFSEPCHILRIQ
jgi:hypothetical protein